jgi:hypothetical protein
MAKPNTTGKLWQMTEPERRAWRSSKRLVKCGRRQLEELAEILEDDARIQQIGDSTEAILPMAETSLACAAFLRELAELRRVGS